MKRSGFQRPSLERAPIVHVPIPEHLRRNASITPVVTTSCDGIPKENVVRSEPYRRLVATLPCIHCGIHHNSQAAHGDEGKGGHIKSDDRTCYPACGPRLGVIGCHALIGSTGSMSRDARRALEQEYARRTRRTIRLLGLWPAGVPHFASELQTSDFA